MTEGSLKLNETARISLSYTEMTSTFPWHQSVTAFCQWTILRGSYDALRRSVCSKARLEFCPTPDEVSRRRGLQLTCNTAVRAVCVRLSLDPIFVSVITVSAARGWLSLGAIALAALSAACASTGAVPRPF